MFRNGIKTALADLYKKHDNVRNRTCDKNFDKRKPDLTAQACTAKTLDIARDNTKTIKTLNENVVTNNKQQLYCICNKPDDGSMYVFCEACHQWLHPKCVFEEGQLALTLTKAH